MARPKVTITPFPSLVWSNDIALAIKWGLRPKNSLHNLLWLSRSRLTSCVPFYPVQPYYLIRYHWLRFQTFISPITSDRSKSHHEPLQQCLSESIRRGDGFIFWIIHLVTFSSFASQVSSSLYPYLPKSVLRTLDLPWAVRVRHSVRPVASVQCGLRFSPRALLEFLVSSRSTMVGRTRWLKGSF